MKFATLFVASFCGLLVLIAPASALDCKKASSPIEKMICNDTELKAADDKMSDAYFALLKSVDNKEIHGFLITSQRRWLKARTDLAKDNADSESVILAQTEVRTKLFQEKLSNGSNAFIEEITKRINFEKNIASSSTGGAFAGYQALCFIGPGVGTSGGYFCESKRTFQNNNRVCISFFSDGPRVDEYRAVAIIRDGRLDTIATCSTGAAATSEQCPEPGIALEGAHWNLKPTGSNVTNSELDHLPSSKYDPDVKISEEADGAWLRACLMDPNYLKSQK
jgi:uncharacterized protein YecT (DUF1311 family)